MKAFFKSIWNIIVHFFWAVFFYGELIKSFDGILMNFGTRIQVAYATWPEWLMFIILLAFLTFSVFLSKATVKLFRATTKQDS